MHAHRTSALLIILSPEDYDRWLDIKAPDAQELLVPYPAAAMKAYAASKRVNAAKNDDATIIAAVTSDGQDCRAVAEQPAADMPATASHASAVTTPDPAPV